MSPEAALSGAVAPGEVFLVKVVLGGWARCEMQFVKTPSGIKKTKIKD